EQTAMLQKLLDAVTLHRKRRKHNFRMAHLYNSSLVALVSTVYSFLSRFLHVFYSLYPNALSDDYRFSLAELREFASVKDAESAAIDKRIDNILGQSFAECIKTIKSILSAPKPFLADCIVDLNEIFQRRHVHVHS